MLKSRNSTQDNFKPNNYKDNYPTISLANFNLWPINKTISFNALKQSLNTTNKQSFNLKK